MGWSIHSPRPEVAIELLDLLFSQLLHIPLLLPSQLLRHFWNAPVAGPFEQRLGINSIT